MGNGAEFLSGHKRGADSEYISIGPAITIGGIKGRLIMRRGGSATHSNLPEYADTSDMYFRQNKDGVCQARVYLDHKVCLDFDWSHDHKNSDGRVFNKGVVHVQMWKHNADGTKERLSDSARFMNNHEMKTYGPLIKEFCKEVKFR